MEPPTNVDDIEMIAKNEEQQCLRRVLNKQCHTSHMIGTRAVCTHTQNRVVGPFVLVLLLELDLAVLFTVVLFGETDLKL